MSELTDAPPSELRPLWWGELNTADQTATPWLWRGYLAPGYITLLTSLWKAGKTTLISVLLQRLGAGGELAGLPVTAAGAVVVTEEPPPLWHQRGLRLGFGPNICWLCRPFRGKPTQDEWLGLIDRIYRLRAENGLGLAVIDPLAAFLPGHDENTASGILTALMPLRRLTGAGMAVFSSHHPRKKGGLDGLAVRGSGALSGFVDILMELGRCHGADRSRRRRLTALSRFEETPQHRIIELNAAGTDYFCVDDVEKEALSQGWPKLLVTLRRPRRKVTRQEVLDFWPPNVPKPSAVSVWRWLDRAVETGDVLCEGEGTRGDPFLYWLPDAEELWQRDPLGLLNDPPVILGPPLT